MHGLRLVRGTGVGKQTNPLFPLRLDREVEVVVILGLRDAELCIEGGRRDADAHVPDPNYIAFRHREIGVEFSDKFW